MLAGVPFDAHAQAWDPLTTLNADINSTYAGPVIDSLGNAWVVINDSVNLSVVGSKGTSGAWGAPFLLGPWIADGGFAATLAVDQFGGVYVVYNGTQSLSGTQPLMWAKYTPASGWQGPWLAYSNPNGFTEVIAAIDSVGRLVVVFPAAGQFGVSSIVYDPATSSWGAVQVVAPATGGYPIIPSMAGNSSGTRLALVYLARRGLEYSFFNSSSAKWDTPALVPNSATVTFSGYTGIGSSYPIAVDSAGNVTVVAALQLGYRRFSIGGFRYEGSTWQLTQLEPSERVLASVDGFASIAQSPSGAVLVATPYSNGSQLWIAALRYTPGVGWDAEKAALVADNALASRCSVAWFNSSEAVVAYENGSEGELAAIYSNGTWSPGPAIPGGYATLYPRMANAPNGDVLLVMDSIGVQEIFGTIATWLRP
jgi:hypothetical protein